MGWKAAAAALAVGLAAFVVGSGAESAIVSAVRGDAGELEWISDVVLSLALTTMTYLWLRLKASRSRVLDLERDRIALDQQLRLAAQIQRELLPVVPDATLGYRWAARMVPASRVGGDFYELVQPAPGSVVAVVADVSGKGIPAALVQASLSTLFRLIARETDDPAQIAERLSAALHERTGGNPYATAIVVRFENAPCQMAYVNAGHPAGFVSFPDGLRTLESNGPPLGMWPGTKYEAAALALAPGAAGVLVTDGVSEAIADPPAMVPRALRGDDGGPRTPADVAERLIRASGERARTDALAPEDDRTVLAFRVEPPA